MENSEKDDINSSKPYIDQPSVGTLEEDLSTKRENDDNLNDQSGADISEISNKSYIWSLDDDEFLELLNKLSQNKKKDEEEQEVGKTLHHIENSDRENQDILDHRSQAQASNDTSFIDINELDPFVVPSHIENEIADSDEEQYLQLRQPDPTQSNAVFGDYSDYFANKEANQQKQDEDFLAWEDQRRSIQSGINSEEDPDEYSDLLSKRSTILKDCIIHVNGYTKPGIHTLHKLIILNGGKFIHHLSAKKAITHILCARLTPRKQKEFKNYKVVKPEWIVDSVRQGKLLYWSKYSIIEVGYGQTKLPFQEQELNLDNNENTDENPDEIADLNDDFPTQEEGQPMDEEMQADVVVDSKHPKFLQTFFSKSRLHHLSNWKQDLRSEYLQLALEQSKPLPKYHNSKKFRVIMHVDFDCFFAKVSSLSHPEIDFNTQPVCVSHASKSNLAISSADISSCNYICRAFGVKNGMWMKNAIKLCPELVCLGYDFEKYEEISAKFYQILMGLGADSVYPVSVDEALVDISSLIDQNVANEQIETFCQNLRRRIYQETQCPVSIGCSTNVLLAKLSLKKAKPNGFCQTFDNIDKFLNQFKVRDLPGFGRANESKLQQFFFQNKSDITVADLRKLTISQLENTFGSKTAQKLQNYSRGIDSTSIDITANPKDFIRKSISIDINWGIRFENVGQIDKFLYEVAKEIHKKLNKLKLVSTNLTLKILKRAKNAPKEPAKYLGSGECDSFSRSSKLGIATNDHKILGTEARALYRSIGCDPEELRGIGIQVNKLISETEVTKQNTLKFTKIDMETFKKKQQKDEKLDSGSSFDLSLVDIPNDMNSSIIEELPAKIKEKVLHQRNLNKQPVLEIPKEIDVDVFNQLPPDIQKEVKQELRRRNIQISDKISKEKNYMYQQIFNAQGKIETIKVLKSPTKKKNTSPKRQNSPLKISTPSPLKKKVKLNININEIDEKILKELPEDVQRSVIEEYKFYHKVTDTAFSLFKQRAADQQQKNSKDPNNNKYTTIQAPIRFQKLTRPKKILDLINQWLNSSIETEISSGDVRILNKYLNCLKSANNQAMYALSLEQIQLFYNMKKNDGVKFSKHWIELMSGYLKKDDKTV